MGVFLAERNNQRTQCRGGEVADQTVEGVGSSESSLAWIGTEAKLERGKNLTALGCQCTKHVFVF